MAPLLQRGLPGGEGQSETPQGRQPERGRPDGCTRPAGVRLDAAAELEHLDTVVCSGYTNVAAKRNKGRIVTRVRVLKRDGSSMRLRFAGGVSDNAYANCKLGPSLETGDVLEFDHTFKGLPRLKIEGAFVESAISYSVVSVSSDPVLRTNPPATTASRE